MAGCPDEARILVGCQSVGGEYWVPASLVGLFGDRKGRFVDGVEEFDFVDDELEGVDRMGYERGEGGMVAVEFAVGR